jgi:hypothetical protein
LIIRTDYGSILPKNNIKKSKKITLCAIFSALSVVIMYIGALFEVLDISMAVIASLLAIVAVIEYGGSAPWMVYGATSILSLIIMPGTTALFYALFFGFYPILKEKFEKKPRVMAWVLKEITFNVSLAIMCVAAIYLFLGTNNALVDPLYISIVVVLAELVFVLYDVALTRLISLYLVHFRRRFKF